MLIILGQGGLYDIKSTGCLDCKYYMWFYHHHEAEEWYLNYLQSKFKNVPKVALKLIVRCLHPKPECRPTIYEILADEFISGA